MPWCFYPNFSNLYVFNISAFNIYWKKKLANYLQYTRQFQNCWIYIVTYNFVFLLEFGCVKDVFFLFVSFYYNCIQSLILFFPLSGTSWALLRQIIPVLITIATILNSNPVTETPTPVNPHIAVPALNHAPLDCQTTLTQVTRLYGHACHHHVTPSHIILLPINHLTTHPHITIYLPTFHR